jgi:hypothetical protein
MFHIQMNTICDGWVTAWEGAEYNTFGEALEQLDEFLEEVKADGLDYSRDDYRIKFIEGIVMEFTPETWEWEDNG